MQPYAYKALTDAGEHAQGMLVAASRREALQRLLARGWHVLELGEGEAPKAVRSVRSLLTRRPVHLADLTRQLATLQRSGVPLSRSITVLIEQSDDVRAKGILSDILDSVRTGSSLSDALGQHSAVFPEIMVSMVRTGEVSGTLDEVLSRLAELFEKQDQIRSEVRAALAYPTLVLALGLASAFALVVFVIPRLELMFASIDQQLPLPTRILMGVSHGLRAYWWLLVAAVVAAGAAWKAAARNPRIRLAWDRFKLRIPWASRLVRQAAIARFARAFGALVHAEVPIVEALNVAQAAAGNRAVAAAVRRMAQQVQAGASLADLMAGEGVFSPLTVQMVAVGEETGRLDEMLLHVADAYDRQAAASARMLTSLLAPVLILCVAVVVAFLIFSLVLPIFQLSAGIR